MGNTRSYNEYVNHQTKLLGFVNEWIIQIKQSWQID
jgi:hypothetical protein